jgi:hypothetical protein
MCGLGVITRLCTNKKRVSHASTSTTPTTAKPRAIHIRAFESHRREPPPACARATAPAPSRRRAAMHAPFLHHIPPLIARIRARTPRSAPRIFRADVADDVSRTPPTLRRSHAARDRPRRSRTRRRRSRCGDANACDEICITPCDWAYLWKVSSDRAAKCRAIRPHRQPRAFVSFGGGRGAMVSRENHVVCAYCIELVMRKSTCNFCHDTRSRAPGENLCV